MLILHTPVVRLSVDADSSSDLDNCSTGFNVLLLNCWGVVQSPKGDISYLQKFFLTYVGGRAPLHLQEDFCGTALLRYLRSLLRSINLSGNILHLLIHFLLYDHDLVRWTVDIVMKTAIQTNLVSVCL